MDMKRLKYFQGDWLRAAPRQALPAGDVRRLSESGGANKHGEREDSNYKVNGRGHTVTIIISLGDCGSGLGDVGWVHAVRSHSWHEP